MKNRRIISAVVFIITIMLYVSGCTSEEVVMTQGETMGPYYVAESDGSETFVIKQTTWGVKKESVQTRDYGYNNLAVGDVISGTSYGEIKVSDVTDEYITLEFSGEFVERSDNGYDLKEETLTKYTVSKGESVKFASKTMSAGVNVTVTYNFD